jgi:hypothetical protein
MDQSSSSPWEILFTDTTRGSIWCDRLQFSIPSSPDERGIAIAFTMRNDMGTSDLMDDLSMDFSSVVNLRE